MQSPCWQLERLLLIFALGACPASYIHQPCNAAFWPFMRLDDFFLLFLLFLAWISALPKQLLPYCFQAMSVALCCLHQLLSQMQFAWESIN